MSAQNDFAQAVAMLSSLNTISQSTHGSDANLEYLQNELFARIRTMVSNNRFNAFHQHAIERDMRHATPIVPQPVRTDVQPPTRRNPLEKIKVIAKNKLEEASPNECAICQDTPKFKDAVCTECGHNYCKTCWAGWMNAERSNKACPVCRKEMPRITTFKARASSKPAPALPQGTSLLIERRRRLLTAFN